MRLLPDDSPLNFGPALAPFATLRFRRWFREEIYPKFVYAPTTESDIAAAMGPYIAFGLNGAIGSTDAVHIHWDKCPAGHKTFEQGKEGFPTIVFNVTVKHDGKAIHISSSAIGSCNDQTLIRFDEFIHLLRTHLRFQNQV
jgi:hypothetical protein